MAFSDFVTRDEWIASYILYILHVLEFPERFPIQVSLLNHLTTGVQLLNIMGYQGWKGIKMVPGEGGPIEFLEKVDGGIEAFQTYFEKGINLREWWDHTIEWLDQQDLNLPAHHRETVMWMLREQQENIQPEPLVGWGGTFGSLLDLLKPEDPEPEPETDLSQS